MTGVTIRRLLGFALAGLAVAATAATAGGASVAQLDKLVLRASQIGPGYRLVQRPDGHGANGFVTLDMCGYRFTSEAKRTGRLQVNYVRAGAAINFSNEVVTYAPGGTRLALREINQAVDHCPSGPVVSTVRGTPPLTYRITRLSTEGLLSGAVALRVHFSAVLNGKRLADTVAAVYQVHGSVLSGVYVYGGTIGAREAAALRVAKQSAKNLVG